MKMLVCARVRNELYNGLVNTEFNLEIFLLMPICVY